MKTILKRSALCLAVTAALSTSSVAFASDTASALRGKILTPAGQPAANTKVVITHLPSGTTRRVETNNTGGFMAKGLRVGGPYKIVVDSDTYKDQEFQNVFLQLGKTKQLNSTLESQQQIERIEVTASVPSFSSAGGSSFFGEDAITNAPSFNRDLKEIVRSNPLAVSVQGDGAELSVAGANPKFNSITVDGIGQNDDFGLNSSGYPTQRSPISIDAIEQLSIETSPFNAKVSNFSGALINAVTKSGTNNMFGSVFYETMSDSFAGTPTDHNGKDIELDFEETTFGATLGGAILEDELFFFVSGEKYDAPAQIEWGPAGSSAPNHADVTESDLARIQQIASTVYGVNPGDWNVTPTEEDEKLLLKLDWNINDEHRSSFTYQYNKGNATRNVTSGPWELRLSSHWYNKEETLNNFAAQLYSDWSDDFSTEMSITYKDVDTVQAASDLSFGDVTVKAESGDVALGPDQYRHANQLQNSTLTMKFDGEYLLDDHSISFGYQFKEVDVFNLFVDSSLGRWVFDSIEDFENRNASQYFYKNAYTNNSNDGAASFKQSEHALYVQDDWIVSDDLTVTLGLRYERLNADESPTYNPNSFARTGYDNSENLDGIDIFLPRFGFTYTVNDDLTLRGGFGRFTGGQPRVWISNGYSNDGVTITSTFNRDVANADIASIPDFALAALTAGDGDTNFVDPNFELPSDWRYQIAADYNFDIPNVGDNFSWSNELLYVQKTDAQFWVDASLLPSDIAGTTTDGGRIIYNDDERRYDIMLTNTDDSGRSIIFSSSLSKNWDNGINMSASYTNQDVEEANPGTSSTAKSSYRYNISQNMNAPTVGTAAYEIEHRFVLTLGYSTELFDGYATRANLFFERRSGKPVSYLMYGRSVTIDGERINDPRDLVSSGISSANLLPYIPTANDSNVIYSSPEAEQEILAAVQELGLSGYAGGYAPKNFGRTPWVNTLDLSIQQDLPGFIEGHKGMVYLTVDNLLNMLDSSQGKVFTNQFNTVRLINGTIDPVSGKYVYDGLGTSNTRAWSKFEPEESTWRMKIGVKYTF